MKVSISTIIVAVCATVAQAKTSYTFYENQFYKGASISGQINNAQCYGVPKGWNDRIRSFALINQNAKNEACIFYNDAGCKGDTHFYNPIPPNQNYAKAQIPAQYDAKWSSFYCAE